MYNTAHAQTDARTEAAGVDEEVWIIYYFHEEEVGG